MKKTRIIIPLLLLAVALSGCGAETEGTTSASVIDNMINNLSSEDVNATSSGKTNQKDTESTEQGKSSDIAWSVEPFLEVDDIDVEDVANDERLKIVAKVYKNGKIGYVRYNGLYAIEPIFDTVTPSYFKLEDREHNVAVSVAEDGSLEFSGSLGFGSPDSPSFYYDAETMDVYESYFGTYAYNDSKPVVTDLIAEKDPGEGALLISGAEKYGLANSEGLILECKYDDGYMDTRETADYYAFQENGKWAYFQRNGKPITDFLYDSFPNHCQGDYFHTHKEGVEWKDHIMPYLPTEGYIAVRSGEDCGYIDVDGNEIYPIGTFEDVRPVHGNKAWAKVDGKWGILDFPEKKTEAIEIKEEDYICRNQLKSIRNAYEDYLIQNNIAYRNIRFIQVNDDEIPELVLFGDGFTMLLTWKDGDVQTLVNSSATAMFGYVEKTGYYLYGGMYHEDTYAKLESDGSVRKIAEFIYDPNAGVGKYFIYDTGSGREVNMTDYDSYVSGLGFSDFDISSMSETMDAAYSAYASAH